jgi:uncharacterized protein (DUF2235 family)
MKRLAVFLDGTWNDSADATNVSRLYDLVAPQDAAGTGQFCHYDPGVGTAPFHRLLGGAFGEGLSRNVCDAYRFLVNNYEDRDEVYIFGFSRGAYTARSLGGLVAFCGLLRKHAPLTIEAITDRYQRRKGSAVPIAKLEFLRRSGGWLGAEDAWLLDCSRRIPIRMIGVWDTVGALGIPWTGPLIGRKALYFHNPNLSTIYEHAFQALALDENRAAYHPTLWTLFAPEASGTPSPLPPAPESMRRVEQRWFIGAHANVGGGYRDDPLSFIPLAWMQGKAERLGLKFKATVTVPPDAWMAPPVDSYSRFLGGAYRTLTLGRRFWRSIGWERRKVKGGWSYPVNEVIDETVFERVQATDYRPKNLLDWAERTGSDLMKASGDQVALWPPRGAPPAGSVRSRGVAASLG